MYTMYKTSYRLLMTRSALIVHHVPKCMSYHKVIGEWAITGRAHSLSF